MRLTLVTPTQLLVDADGVLRLRARDASGAFGVLPGHTEFVTHLAVSVLSWTDARGEHHVALRGGTLVVEPGDRIRVATREAVLSDDLSALEPAVVDRLRHAAEVAEKARVSSVQLERALIRQAVRALQGPAEVAP